MTVTGMLDRSAIVLSIICAVHCLAVPLAVVMMPVASTYWFADDHFHFLLLYLVLPTSTLAICLGCRRHRTFKVIAWGSAGLGFLVLGALLGHDRLGELGEKGITLLGAGFIVLAHVHNFRLCRQSQCAH